MSDDTKMRIVIFVGLLLLLVVLLIAAQVEKGI